ncbi:MAG: hypothetical protein ACRD0Z_08705 [Acidimicrobiales bacterium]
MKGSCSAFVKSRVGRSLVVLCSVAMAAGVMSAATVSAAGASPKAKPAPHVVRHNQGDVSCAQELIAVGNTSPAVNDGAYGGETARFYVKWLGSPSNPACTMAKTTCPDFWGSCDAGYWVAGLWCSTLASSDLAAGQSDCDLNNIVVLTDYDTFHTSYNKCSTVKVLGSIFGGLPGTLNCVTDGDGEQGWTESWDTNGVSNSGQAWGPIPQSGSSTGFNPSNTAVDCPPSAANVAAGAVKGYCAFVFVPINFTYYCVFDICAPDTGAANDGVSEDTSQYTAVAFKYAEAETP